MPITFKDLENKSFLKNQLKVFLELFKIITYRSLGIKYLKYGITLGPFTNYFWFYQKIIARLSFLIVVRDKNNYESLIERGLKNTFLKPDLALKYLLSVLVALLSSRKSVFCILF